MPEINLGKKAKGATMPDIGTDCCEILLEESAQAHTALMSDTKGNIQNVSHVARATGVKKFDEVGEIEAAATEYVLRERAPGS